MDATYAFVVLASPITRELQTPDLQKGSMNAWNSFTAGMPLQALREALYASILACR